MPSSLDGAGGASIETRSQRAAFLELMTPGLRGLFENQVEPLVAVMRCREALALCRQKKAAAEQSLKRNGRLLQENRARLDEAAVTGSDDYRKAQTALLHVGRRVLKHEEKRRATLEAIAKLHDKLAELTDCPDVAATLAELEGPILSRKEILRRERAASAAAAASAGGAASEEASSGPARKKSKKGGRRRKATTTTAAATPEAEQEQQQQQRGGGVSRLEDLMCRPDLAANVLAFLDVHEALHGLGGVNGTMPGAIMEAMSCISVNARNPDMAVGLCWLAGFPRLRHLSCEYFDFDNGAAWAAEVVRAGLPARLESFAFRYLWDMVDSPDKLPAFKVLVSAEWPELLDLNMGFSLGAFLDAVAARPGLVFPRLRSLATHKLTCDQAGTLSRLLDRGAFPSLRALTRCGLGWMDDVTILPDERRGNDMEQQCALLARLPDTPSLELGDFSTPIPADGPCTALLGSGSLANLRRLNVWVNQGEDLSPLLNTIGSGALPLLEHLRLGHGDDPPAAVSQPGAPVDFVPNALSNLRALRILCHMSDEQIVALLDAAGPRLSELEIREEPAATQAGRMLAEEE